MDSELTKNNEIKYELSEREAKIQARMMRFNND